MYPRYTKGVYAIPALAAQCVVFGVFVVGLSSFVHNLVVHDTPATRLPQYETWVQLSLPVYTHRSLRISSLTSDLCDGSKGRKGPHVLHVLQQKDVELARIVFPSFISHHTNTHACGNYTTRPVMKVRPRHQVYEYAFRHALPDQPSRKNASDHTLALLQTMCVSTGDEDTNMSATSHLCASHIPLMTRVVTAVSPTSHRIYPLYILTTLFVFKFLRAGIQLWTLLFIHDSGHERDDEDHVNACLDIYRHMDFQLTYPVITASFFLLFHASARITSTLQIYMLVLNGVVLGTVGIDMCRVDGVVAFRQVLALSWFAYASVFTTLITTYLTITPGRIMLTRLDFLQHQSDVGFLIDHMAGEGWGLINKGLMNHPLMVVNIAYQCAVFTLITVYYAVLWHYRKKDVRTEINIVYMYCDLFVHASIATLLHVYHSGDTKLSP